MQLNRVIALILVVVCFAAAALGITRRQNEATVDLNAFRSKGDRLELVSLNGAISGSTPGTRAVLDRVVELQKEDQVKGILLSINSPGGTVGMSKEIYAAVRVLREVKPVVVTMLDQAASGGYYIASAGTKIYANPGTLTGSIGVILSGLNFKGLFEKVGIESQTIKTGPFKDIFSSYRQISDPERQLLQDLLQSTYIEFVNDVADARKMDLEVVKKLADGRIYTGSQAKENGLVDAIGTSEEALSGLRKLVREKFKLPADRELPIERSPASIDRLLDQFLGQSAISSSSQFSPVLDSILKKLSGFHTTATTKDSSNFDPPILLMPSWYQ
jgi:protease IV